MEINLPVSKKEPVQYSLHAFCFHTPGHYMSYVRDFSRDTHEGDWYKYNDRTVTAVRTSRDYEEMNHYATTSATLTFYVRNDMISAQREVVIPDRIAKLANLMLSLEEIQSQKDEIKRKAEFELWRQYSPPAPGGKSLNPF